MRTTFSLVRFTSRPVAARQVDDRRGVDPQLDPAHQAGAADLDDHRVLQRQRPQPAFEMIADASRTCSSRPLVHQLFEERTRPRGVASRLPP